MFFPWLINTATCQIEKDVPVETYAILSHHWAGDDEIKFNTLRPGDLQRSKKIRGAIEIAKAANYPYIWIDSVCMDKSNAVETSTNINSMFDYYQNAEVCITYLSDVDTTKTRLRKFEKDTDARQNSVWFTRGWTLQELLASPYMWFYDKNWQFIADKEDESVKKELQAATKIDPSFLNGDLAFRSASVATRMSWMAGRTTTRTEDIAYSMLGILGISMEPQYGEGVRAFLRLQKTLLDGDKDESIFAWTWNKVGLGCYSSLAETPWVPNSWGLLAPSPDCFAESANVILPAKKSREEREYTWVQNGVQFKVPQKSGTDVTNWFGLPRKEIKFALNCLVDNKTERKPTVVIHLKSRDGINYERVRCDTLDPTLGARPSSNRVFKIDQVITRPLTVGQTPFDLPKSSQPNDQKRHASPPRGIPRWRTTNTQLAPEINAISRRIL